MFLACLTTAAAFSSAADDVARDLWWNHDRGGDFGTAENWLVGDKTVAETGPTSADTVRFCQGGCTATSDRTVTFDSDVTVSNFVYGTTTRTGKLTLDLNGKVVTVDSELHLSTQGNGTVGDQLYVKNGKFRVINSFQGGKIWGMPDEGRSGFFVNRQNSQNSGLMAIFDNVEFDMETQNETCFYFNTLYGGEHYAIFTNGSTLVCTNMTMKANPATGSARIVFDGEGTRLTVDKSKTSEAGGNAKFAVNISGNSEVEFRNGATLEAGALVKDGSATLFLRGGNHRLRGVNDWGNQHSLCIYGGVVAVTNGLDGESCNLAVGKNIRALNHGRLYVGPDCIVTNNSNSYLYLGKLESGTPAYGGELEIDGGHVAISWLRLGGQKSGSNSVVRIRGAHARLEQKSSQEWGQDKAMTVNYGCGIEFELPEDGFHDAAGKARAPIYAAGCISTTTADGIRPIYLKLKTKTFDRANPTQTITLIQATAKTNNENDDTSAFYAKLLETVVWENARHGELSVSEDGKCLLYTAPPKYGLAVIVR